MAELADAGDLKSSGLNTLVGSTPTRPITVYTGLRMCYTPTYMALGSRLAQIELL